MKLVALVLIAKGPTQFRNPATLGCILECSGARYLHLRA